LCFCLENFVEGRENIGIYISSILTSFPWTIRPLRWFKNSVHFSTSPLPHACNISRLSHSTWSENPNNIWWGVQIMKLLNSQFSPVFFYLLHLRPQYLLHHTILENPLPIYFPQSDGSDFIPYETNGKIIVLLISVFILLERKREEIRLWTDWKQAFPHFSLLLISS